MDELTEAFYGMLLLFNEGLFHVKDDTLIQGMRPLYKAGSLPKQQPFSQLRDDFILPHSEGSLQPLPPMRTDSF